MNRPVLSAKTDQTPCKLIMDQILLLPVGVHLAHPYTHQHREGNCEQKNEECFFLKTKIQKKIFYSYKSNFWLKTPRGREILRKED